MNIFFIIFSNLGITFILILKETKTFVIVCINKYTQSFIKVPIFFIVMKINTISTIITYLNYVTTISVSLFYNVRIKQTCYAGRKNELISINRYALSCK